MKHSKHTHKYSEKYAIKIKQRQISPLYYFSFSECYLFCFKLSSFCHICCVLISQYPLYPLPRKILFYCCLLRVLRVILRFTCHFRVFIVGEDYLLCFKLSASRFSRSASCSFNLACSKRLASSKTAFSYSSTCFRIILMLSRL